MENMIEPISPSAGGIAVGKWLWPIAKLLGIPAAGLIGALFVAAFDPAEAMPDPKQRRKLVFFQYTCGLTVAWLFTHATVRWLDHTLDWIDLPKILTTPEDVGLWLEVALPVGFIWGGVSIGLIGALVKLRKIIADRGAKVVADRVGMGEDQS